MTYVPPTLQEERDFIDSSFESKTEQNISSLSKEFIPILKNVLALITVPIYKYISNKYKNAFVITSNETTLENVHGKNLDTERDGKVKFKCLAMIAVSGNAHITSTTTIENETNGLYYFPDYEKDLTVTDYVVDITADGYGSEYNLDPGDSLNIIEQITNVNGTAVVVEATQYGEDKEDIEAYRRRLIIEQSSASGGGNTADYRKWGESVNGVFRVFPFSGRPLDPDNSMPGDISIFVESDSAFGTDGLASSDLIDSVFSAMLVDPDTGQTRPSLGDTEELLLVESVSHVTFNVTVNGIITTESLESTIETKLNTVVDEYLRSITPYCFGIDPDWNRNDNISSVTLSQKINESLKQFSATASTIIIEESGVGTITNRQMVGGEIARLGTLTPVFE
jgi:hypothetical protein